VTQLVEYDDEAHEESRALGAGSYIPNCALCEMIDALRNARSVPGVRMKP